MKMESEKWPEQKVCEACGETFGCGARADGCWCTEVDLPEDVAAQLSTGFSDCLCPKCLGERAGHGAAS